MTRRLQGHLWIVWGAVLGVLCMHGRGWAQGPVWQQTPQGVRITVQLGFAPQTHELPPKAARVLDQVGRILKDDVLHARTIAIVGHANDSEYVDVNWTLSERRALAVQQYLVEHHSIPITRLLVVAKGEGEPLDRANPRSERNRCIQFLSQ